MAQINEIILSEINGLQNVSTEMKDFLKWILEFERENMDKENYSYKQEIERKLEQILNKEATQEGTENDALHK